MSSLMIFLPFLVFAAGFAFGRLLGRRQLADEEKRRKESEQHLKEVFNGSISHLKTEMKAATEDMLRQRQQEFSDSSRRTMKEVIGPLNETIGAMKQKMEAYTQVQNEFKGSLDTNIQTIIRQAEAASRSAEELTTALKHSNKVQGDYGEFILSELLASQGLVEGVHFDLQYVERDEAGRELKGEDGRGLRPDVVLHLDGKRDVIIDSKMNLTDFIRFTNAETPEEGEEYLKKHVRSLENQVKLLSAKDYARYHKNTNARMDYVILFVPISAALWEALRCKPSLWREAMDRNVYIADGQTLFAALRIIRLTWTQIEQMNSQQEIFSLANEMLRRVNQFLDHYKAIGGKLRDAQAAYEKGYEKLTPGGQSIVTTANKLVQKGVKVDKGSALEKVIDAGEDGQLPEK